MINCPLQLVDGKWTCPLCGWVYPLDSEKPPHRNCPKSPGGREGRMIATVHQINLKRENEINWTMYPPRHLIDMEKILGICLDCPEHNGNTCVVRGTDCKARGHWLKRLACLGFRECERWTTSGS